MSEPFLEFWGKAQPSEGAAAGWHPAACHCLDVAAVAKALLHAHPAAARHVAEACAWAPEAFIDTSVFLIALHDIGKFSRPFQAKAPQHWPSVLGPYRNEPGPHHTEAGLRLLREPRILDVLDEALPGWTKQSTDALLDAVAGHHGRPVLCPPPLETNIACTACLDAAHAFVAATAGLIKPSPLAPPPKRAAETASWWLAGLTTLCDWIGSGTQWFRYEGDAVRSLEGYWLKAQQRAEVAVAESGLLPVAPNPAPGLAMLMPQIKAPTPMQALAEGLTLPNGPVSIIVEDVTGGGKTEAALLLVQRLIADGRADGLFIALPTMATADAMFDRLAESYRRLFTEQARPSLALAHGHAALNDLFQGSILAKAAAADLEATDAEDTASAQCAAWLAEERRRVFFAHVGVGTIDQALLAVLAARYAALRLFGLSRKVLVVDEAHAYDPYMSEELDRLLAFHAMLGGSSIILSATLPQVRRNGLLHAVANGLAAAPYEAMKFDYPLVTVAGRRGGFECAVPIREELRRNLPVRRLSDTAEAVALLVQAAHAGACAIWIRNTVDDARAAGEALRKAGILPVLFHARFAMGDRLAIQRNVLSWFGKEAADRAPDGIGRVLVATQVVEQSLDLDADVLVTDLAPIELLIQRAGRLQRHPERHRPPGFKSPEFLVLSPDPVDQPEEDWAEDAAIGGTRFVYGVHILWLSARTLFGAKTIHVPEGIRPLVEAVYGDAAENIPPALQTAQEKADGDGLAQRGHARANLLELRKGYTYLSGKWAHDVVMPTRLGDDYITFRMAREENEALVSWFADDDPARVWAFSEIALRRSIADEEIIPARLMPALARLRAGWRAWQKDIPILVMTPGEAGAWTTVALRRGTKVCLDYDQDWGFVVR